MSVFFLATKPSHGSMKNHAEISGQSLIPENDPSVLFTMAGMHPLVPYLLGEKHPAGTRLTDYQKCIRTGDIEEVGVGIVGMPHHIALRHRDRSSLHVEHIIGAVVGGEREVDVERHGRRMIFVWQHAAVG